MFYVICETNMGVKKQFYNYIWGVKSLDITPRFVKGYRIVQWCNKTYFLKII